MFCFGYTPKQTDWPLTACFFACFSFAHYNLYYNSFCYNYSYNECSALNNFRSVVTDAGRAGRRVSAFFPCSFKIRFRNAHRVFLLFTYQMMAGKANY